MRIRRVVTGYDEQGKTVVKSDAQMQRPFESLPGFANTLLWSTDSVPRVGIGHGDDPVAAVTQYLPEPGATRLMVVSVPPDSATAAPGFDGAAFGMELAQKVPGLAETFEMDSPGMHTTDTVDYGVLLDGELWLELGDGKEVKIGPTDVVVQNGIRHAWRNKSTRPATILFVLIGASRSR